MTYYENARMRLLCGNVIDIARSLPGGSVDAIVTSPPYFGLRTYDHDDQFGLEATPGEYVENLRTLFAELRRALTDGGTLWLNLGDSYASGNRTTYDADGGKIRVRGRAATRAPSSIPCKNLLGIPWRVAFALQDDGWILRNEIVWHKPNAMPNSVQDRLSTRHEKMFLFSKSQKYFFDLDAVREECVTTQPGNPSFRANGKSDRRAKNHASPPGQAVQTNMVATGTRHLASHARGKNPGDVWRPNADTDFWSINTHPFKEAHFACFPPELARRPILAGCPAGGVVLDPFAGSCTTGRVALDHGRRFVGIDLNSNYLDIALSSDKRLGPYVGAIGLSLDEFAE
jgi:site-specific DNA-methyltransferase (cytosine-N4-specific)